MSTTTSSTSPQQTKPKAILTVSSSQYLANHPVASVIAKDWAKPKADNGVRERFENVGFTVDPLDVEGTLKGIEKVLGERVWDGVLIGWCTRGHVEFTEIFEQIVALVVKQILVQPGLKLMFSAGPENLVETVVRNFPE